MGGHLEETLRMLKKEYARKSEKAIAEYEAVYNNNAASPAEVRRKEHEILVRLDKIEADKRAKLAPRESLLNSRRGGETNPIEIDSDDDPNELAGFQGLDQHQFTRPTKTEVKDEAPLGADVEDRASGSEPKTKRARTGTLNAAGTNAVKAADSTTVSQGATGSRHAANHPANPIDTAPLHALLVRRQSSAVLLHEDKAKTNVSTLDSNWIHLNTCAMVVYSVADRKWFMIACSLCGANWSHENFNFFKSLEALRAHVKAHLEASDAQGVAAVLGTYVFKAYLSPEEALLISEKPTLLPSKFRGRLLRAVDTSQVPSRHGENKLRRRLDAILSAVPPPVRCNSRQENEQQSHTEPCADKNEDKRPRKSIRCRKTPIAAETDGTMQDVTRTASVAGLISHQKIKLGERKGWHCLKACPVVIKHIDSGKWFLVFCKTCQTNASRKCRTWYTTVNAFYMHMAGHEGVPGTEIKELVYETVWEKHAHLLPLTEEQVLRIDARPRIVPMLVKGRLLESCWLLEPSWLLESSWFLKSSLDGFTLRVIRGSNWDLDSLERSLRTTLGAQATEPGSATPTDRVLKLRLPSTRERSRELVSEQTRSDANVDQTNTTRATEVEVDSTYRSMSSPSPPWGRSSDEDEDDSDSDASLDSDTPIFPSGRLA